MCGGRTLVLAGLLALGAAGTAPPRPATAQERLTNEQILRLQAIRAAVTAAGRAAA